MTKRNPTDTERLDFMSKDCGVSVVASESTGRWFTRSHPHAAHVIDRWTWTRDLREAIDAAMTDEFIRLPNNSTSQPDEKPIIRINHIMGGPFGATQSEVMFGEMCLARFTASEYGLNHEVHAQKYMGQFSAAASLYARERVKEAMERCAEVADGCGAEWTAAEIRRIMREEGV